MTCNPSNYIEHCQRFSNYRDIYKRNVYTENRIFKPELNPYAEIFVPNNFVSKVDATPYDSILNPKMYYITLREKDLENEFSPELKELKELQELSKLKELKEPKISVNANLISDYPRNANISSPATLRNESPLNTKVLTPKLIYADYLLFMTFALALILSCFIVYSTIIIHDMTEVNDTNILLNHDP